MTSDAARILVVDDEPSIRTTVSLLLKLEGFVVDSAVDGRAGLQAALDCPPALILSDIHMPHMDGHALLAAVRSSASLVGTRVVLLAVPPDRSLVSATTGPGRSPGSPKNDCTPSGGLAEPGLGAHLPDAWLAKPFTRAQLLDLIRSLLG